MRITCNVGRSSDWLLFRNLPDTVSVSVVMAFPEDYWSFTAAGLSGIFTRFPFNPPGWTDRRNRFRCKCMVFEWDMQEKYVFDWMGGVKAESIGGVYFSQCLRFLGECLFSRESCMNSIKKMCQRIIWNTEAQRHRVFHFMIHKHVLSVSFVPPCLIFQLWHTFMGLDFYFWDFLISHDTLSGFSSSRWISAFAVSAFNLVWNWWVALPSSVTVALVSTRME